MIDQDDNDGTGHPAPSALADQAIRLAAAQWHARLNDRSSPHDLRRFNSWLAADARHAAAYVEVERAAEKVRALAQAPEILALRDETHARLAARRPRASWQLPRIAAALALVVLVGGLAWMESEPARRGNGTVAIAATGKIFQTGADERIDVRLADGSRVRLNTQSKVRISYTEGARQVALLEGQALFDVAKNPRRPFTVTARGDSVTALGTLFDVRLDEQRLRVALVEGAVVVRSGSRDVATMKPNDVLVIQGGRAVVSHYADMRRFVSWQDGLMVFDNTPLSEAVAELNRYEKRPIVLGDARVGSIRVSGTFEVGHSAEFLTSIEQILPVRVVQKTPEMIVISYAK